MIIYRASDVKLSWQHQPAGDFAPRTCGYIKEGPDDGDEYLEDGIKIEEEDGIHVMEKRQADQYEYTPKRTRCPLLLVADYRFFQEMGASNTKTTINYLVQKKS